jgi:tryptophan-rich sensory protein
MKLSNVLSLIICLAIPLIVGGVSGYLTVTGLNGWYTTLVKPSFNPPNFVFGPVWTTLYLLMGVSMYMIWIDRTNPLRRTAIIAYAVQLFLNFWWSLLFFQFQNLLAALGEIILMWFAIIFMIVTFRRIKPLAAYIQIPYLLWVSFATVLTASLWWLNK